MDEGAVVDGARHVVLFMLCHDEFVMRLDDMFNKLRNERHSIVRDDCSSIQVFKPRRLLASPEEP